MGDVVDFNMARLKRCLPLANQGNLLEARIAALISGAEGKPEVVKEVIGLMRKETCLSEAEKSIIDRPIRWPRDPSM
jgi:hypothetical protein